MPRSSSRTSARTIDSPVPAGAPSRTPGAVVGDREHDVAVAARELDADLLAAVLERVLQQLGEHERERCRARAGKLDRLELRRRPPCRRRRPARASRAAGRSGRRDRRPRRGARSAARAPRRSRGSGSPSARAPRAGRSSPTTRACRRSSDATVCRLFFTRWWISCASTPRITARPCSSATAACVAIDASSSRSPSLNGDSRSATSSPICRPRQRSGWRTACVDATPSGHAMRPSSSTSAAPVASSASIVVLTIASSDSSRYSDSDTASRDARERLQLVHAPLRLGVELRVLDRLRDLRRDREQQLDLVLRERARLARAHVERALERAVARQDRHREDRLVLVLRQVREVLEARVEVRLRLEHHRRPRRGGRAGDAFAGSHARPARHLVDRRAVRRAQDQLVGALVVEVDEARVRLERAATFVATRASTSCRSSVELTASIVSVSSRRCRSCFSIRGTAYARLVDHYHWLLMLHVTAAFLFVGGSVAAGRPQHPGRSRGAPERDRGPAAPGPEDAADDLRRRRRHVRLRHLAVALPAVPDRHRVALDLARAVGRWRTRSAGSAASTRSTPASWPRGWRPRATRRTTS